MHGGFAGAGNKYKSFGADDIAQVKPVLYHFIKKAFVLAGADIIPFYIKLYLSPAVLYFNKKHLALIIDGHNTASHRNAGKLFFDFFRIGGLDIGRIMRYR